MTDALGHGRDGEPLATLPGVLRLYRAALARCALPAALLAALLTAQTLALMRQLGDGDDLLELVARVQALQQSPAFWRGMLLATIATVLAWLAMTASLHAVAVRAPPPTLDGLPLALLCLPAALVTTLLFLVVTTLASVPLLVPGTWLWGMWQLWMVVLVVERSGPVAALTRSWQLVRGSWWPATTLVTVVSLIALLAPWLAAGLIGGFVGSGAGGTAPWPMVLLQGAALALALPLVPAALVALYVDLSRGRPGRAA